MGAARMVVLNTGSLTTNETWWRDLIVSEGHTVVLHGKNAAAPNPVVEDMVLFSPDLDTDQGTKWDATDKTVIALAYSSHSLYDTGGGGGGSVATTRYVYAGHAWATGITGLPDAKTFYSSTPSNTFYVPHSSLGAGAVVVHTATGNTERVTASYYMPGALFPDGSASPGKRANVDAYGDDGPLLTGTGLQVYKNMIAWGMDVEAPPALTVALKMAVVNIAAETPAETSLKNILTGLGHTVTTFPETEALNPGETAYGYIWGPSCTQEPGTKFDSVLKPVISFCEFLPHSKFSSSGAFLDIDPRTTLYFFNTDSPWLTNITGLPDNKTIYTTSRDSWRYYSPTAFPATFKKIAALGSDPTWGVTRVAGGYYNAGDLLSDNVTSAPERRGFILFRNIENLTGTGSTVLTNILNWFITEQTNVAPAISATVSPSSAAINESVTFNGSSSTDSDGTITSYSWSFGDGTPNGTGATVTHAYTTTGTKTWSLTVTDNEGATATTGGSIVVSDVTYEAARLIRVGNAWVDHQSVRL